MRVLETPASEVNPQWYMEDMGQQLFEPPNVSGWRPNDYWFTTSRLWARATWASSVVWRQNVHGGNVQDTLSAITSKSVPDAIQYGFDYFGIDSPSAHTRTKLETWLTAQRADNHAWAAWTFINLLTLLMLSPEFNLA
jgi:uncharacterized protein DUF1800